MMQGPLLASCFAIQLVLQASNIQTNQRWIMRNWNPEQHDSGRYQ